MTATFFRRSVLVAALATWTSATAWGSGDGCEPVWTLDFATKPDCANTNVAALMPGNDTRANLLLLMNDQRTTSRQIEPAPLPLLDWKGFRTAFSSPIVDTGGMYGTGEGSRCRSDEQGIKAFSNAVDATAGLPANERTVLKAVRGTLSPHCVNEDHASTSPTRTPDGGSFDTALQDVTSPVGVVYGTYLRAADDFYVGRFSAAAAKFRTLETQSDPWLADTAAYMVGRTAVNALQVNAFDEYGTFKGSPSIDQTAAHDAAASLDRYLIKHPDGLYVASARGLQRRIAWLAGWTEDLAARYADLLSRPPASRGLDDATLAEEIDNKLLPDLRPGMTKDPILLATLDLKALRTPDKGAPPPARPDLATQRDTLNKVPGLYDHLIAVEAFFADNDPKAVIHALPDDTRRRGGNMLWFSRQMLRGLALEAVGDRNARGFWKELRPATSHPLQGALTELALAFDDEHRSDVEDAFDPKSGVDNSAIRAILLMNDAGSALLRARESDAAASERERAIALFTLLRKDLTHGAYRDFVADASRIPPDAPTAGSGQIDPINGEVPTGVFVRGKTEGEIDCPALASTAASLAGDPRSARGRLCLAEWFRLNDFDPDHFATPLTSHDLGFGPSEFPGEAATRSSIYRAVIADEAASADERAYALYRAVKCYEPSGYNGCGGSDAPKSERHRWFDTLKSEYPGSRWAKSVQFWW